jgi:hypothetical protein
MYTADRETGTFIEQISSIKEGKDIIVQYEQEDMKNGVYEANFYCIVDENHCII